MPEGAWGSCVSVWSLREFGCLLAKASRASVYVSSAAFVTCGVCSAVFLRSVVVVVLLYCLIWVSIITTYLKLRRYKRSIGRLPVQAAPVLCIYYNIFLFRLSVVCLLLWLSWLCRGVRCLEQTDGEGLWLTGSIYLLVPSFGSNDLRQDLFAVAGCPCRAPNYPPPVYVRL